MGVHDWKPQYGNWIPGNVLLRFWGMTGVLLLGFSLSLVLGRGNLLPLLLGISLFMVGSMTLYLQFCHYAYAFHGGGVMGEIHRFLLTRLPWKGQERLLEIGCGSGALTIRCAKAFPEAEVIGLDLWGKGWEYSQEQCQKNAERERVQNIGFIRGDAAALPFPDQAFDAVISNLTFHEVSEERDKRKLVIEALRVLKKGGVFAFQDLFEERRLYGDIQEFCAELCEAGIETVNYEPHSEQQSFIPRFLQKPIMLHNLGILSGKK